MFSVCSTVPMTPIVQLGQYDHVLIQVSYWRLDTVWYLMVSWSPNEHKLNILKALNGKLTCHAKNRQYRLVTTGCNLRSHREKETLIIITTLVVI